MFCIKDAIPVYEELDDDEIRISDKKISISPRLVDEERTIVIWGYNRKLKYILNSILANNKSNSIRKYKVVIIGCEEQADQINTLLNEEENLHLLCAQPVFTSNGYNIEHILSAMPEKIHSMLILSRDDYVDDEKDKEVFEVWMSIHHEMENDIKLKEKLEGRLIFEVYSSNNANILQLNAEDQVVISSELSSLFMVQMAIGSTIEEILLDLTCIKADQDIYDGKIIEQDQCDLQIMSARELFDIDAPIEFTSKQDMVNKVFYGSEKEYLPLGLIIFGTLFLFTNGGKTAKEIVGNGDIPCMSNGYLIAGDGNIMHMGEDDYDYKNGLLVDPEYEVVLIHREHKQGLSKQSSVITARLWC